MSFNSKKVAPIILQSNKTFILFIFISVSLLIASIFSALSIGSVHVSINDIYSSLTCVDLVQTCNVSDINHQIIWEIRLPRILMALITGAGLAITGAVLQSVTRNPLADPYLFGISSGAALGAVASMALGGVIFSIIPAQYNFFELLDSSSSFSISTGALIGAIFSVFLMLTLAGRDAVKVDHLLLSGVAVSFMLSAFTSLILYYSEPDTTATLLFWMMGSFSNTQWHNLNLPFFILFIGSSIFFFYRRWLTAIQAGHETSLTLGIPVNKFRLSMLIVSAVITGVLVAQVGGIGFVGLMIPHIVRFMVGSQVHKLLMMSLIIGAIFMIWVDVVARSLFELQVIPIGIVTSAIGSLFFFVILKLRSS